MGIRSGCGRRIQEQETAPFLFCQKGLMEKLPNISVNLAKEQSKGRGEKKSENAPNTRGPLFLHSGCCLYC